MGFFDSLWSGIKNVAGNIWSGIKGAADWVGEKVQPIVKAVGDYASYVPIIGAPIAGIAQQINKGIDVARGVIGKVDQVGQTLSKIGSQGQTTAKSFSRTM